jgi:hypothetical protein
MNAPPSPSIFWREVEMKTRLSLILAILVPVFLMTLLGGAAAADPLNKPTYTLQCGSTTYTVVSPDSAATGSDVNSTSQLIVAIGNVPEELLTFCTATPVGGGESFEALFLITPAGPR